MIQITEVLASFGLTRNEAKVYLALLETGQTTSGALVAKSGLYIPRVYDALEGLQRKGMASFVLFNSQKRFEAVPPEHLRNILAEKQRQLEEALPRMNSIVSRKEHPETAAVFKGVHGIRTVLDGILGQLKAGGRYSDFGVSLKFRDVMGPYWHAWQSSKRKWKIRSRVICNENARTSQAMKEYIGASAFHQARFVPERFSCPSDTMVLPDRIVIFSWEAAPPVAVVIRDEPTVKGYHNIFEWMWKSASK